MQTLHHSILDLLDKSYDLSYIDYDESLANNLTEVQEAIQKQDWQPLDYLFDDWLWERQAESVSYVMEKLINDIASSFDVDMIKAENFVDKWQDTIRDEIYERDDSTPLKDLIRHTSDPICFYDTGVEICGESPFKEDWEMEDDIKAIKKALKIKTNDYDDKLELMIMQASYGGLLVVYFRGDIQDMMNLKDKNIVTFKNPMIAIVDHWNGSGDNTELIGHKFTLSFAPENIFLDKCIKYSYTYDVCGMIESWCDCTMVTFGRDLRYKSLKEHSTLHEYLERENKLNETFKAGKCTPMDMDYKRHRNQVYINSYPCGTKCLDCGTFWID